MLGKGKFLLTVFFCCSNTPVFKIFCIGKPNEIEISFVLSHILPISCKGKNLTLLLLLFKGFQSGDSKKHQTQSCAVSKSQAHKTF